MFSLSSGRTSANVTHQKSHGEVLNVKSDDTHFLFECVK